MTSLSFPFRTNGNELLFVFLCTFRYDRIPIDFIATRDSTRASSSLLRFGLLTVADSRSQSEMRVATSRYRWTDNTDIWSADSFCLPCSLLGIRLDEPVFNRSDGSSYIVQDLHKDHCATCNLARSALCEHRYPRIPRKLAQPSSPEWFFHAEIDRVFLFFQSTIRVKYG